MATILDDFTTEEYFQLKYSRLTDEQIADLMFVSLQTLKNWKWRVGIEDKVRNRKIDYKKARELKEMGYSYSAISRRFGCTPQAVMYALKGGTSMKCPDCNSTKLKIIDSREKDNSKRRRRECQTCGYRWTTYEMNISDDEAQKLLTYLYKGTRRSDWTNEEDRKLMKMYQDKIHQGHIAIALGRSYNAINKRVRVLGLTELYGK